MASINANVTIDLPDGTNFESYVQQIREQLSKLTGLDTKINVIEVDDPISLSPIQIRKLKE